jgi:hypothetical protein
MKAGGSRAEAAVVAGVLLTAFVATLAARVEGPAVAWPWAALVLLAFVGYGRGVARLLRIDGPVDWGLAAAWGLAAVVCLGGVLVAVRVMSRPLAIGIVGLGLALLAAEAWRTGVGFATLARRLVAAFRREPGFHVGLAALGALLALVVLGAALQQAFYWICDDQPIYAVFPAQILGSGGPRQPFSFRGLTSYGGQGFLQALMEVRLRADELQLFDKGLCLVIVVGLVLGATKRWPQRTLALLLLAALVALPDNRSNLTSMTSGAVVLLALYRTLRLEAFAVEGPRRAVFVLSALAAAAVALRQNCLVPAVGTLGLSAAFVVARRLRGASAGWRALDWRAARPALVEAAWSLGGLVVLLAPWWWTAYRSAGTFLFPLARGNFNSPVRGFGPAPWREQARISWDTLTFDDGALRALGLFLFLGLLVRDRSPRRAMLSTFVAAGLGSFALVTSFRWAGPGDFHRYQFAFGLALVTALVLEALSSDDAPAGEAAPPDGETPDGAAPDAAARVTWPAVLAVVALVVQLHDGRATAFAQLTKTLDVLRAAKLVRAPEPAVAEYRGLQALVPAHATLLTMLDEPYRLDFARNEIFVLDLPGIVSPPPGLPLTGVDPFASYLLARGIRYFAWTRPEMSRTDLFSTAVWRVLDKSNEPIHVAMKPGVHAMWQIEKDLLLARPVLYQSATLVLVDLARR